MNNAIRFGDLALLQIALATLAASTDGIRPIGGLVERRVALADNRGALCLERVVRLPVRPHRSLLEDAAAYE